MDLLDRCQEMIGHIHTHQQEAAGMSLPRHVREEEDDLRFQAANAGFTREDLEDMLKEMDFASSEIDLDTY